MKFKSSITVYMRLLFNVCIIADNATHIKMNQDRSWSQRLPCYTYPSKYYMWIPIDNSVIDLPFRTHTKYLSKTKFSLAALKEYLSKADSKDNINDTA